MRTCRRAVCHQQQLRKRIRAVATYLIINNRALLCLGLFDTNITVHTAGELCWTGQTAATRTWSAGVQKRSKALRAGAMANELSSVCTRQCNISGQKPYGAALTFRPHPSFHNQIALIQANPDLSITGGTINAATSPSRSHSQDMALP